MKKIYIALFVIALFALGILVRNESEEATPATLSDAGVNAESAVSFSQSSSTADAIPTSGEGLNTINAGKPGSFSDAFAIGEQPTRDELAQYYSTLDDRTLLGLLEYEAPAALELARRSFESTYHKNGIDAGGTEHILLAIALDAAYASEALDLLAANVIAWTETQTNSKVFAVALLREKLGLDAPTNETREQLQDEAPINISDAYSDADDMFRKIAQYRARLFGDRTMLEEIQ